MQATMQQGMSLLFFSSHLFELDAGRYLTPYLLEVVPVVRRIVS